MMATLEPEAAPVVREPVDAAADTVQSLEDRITLKRMLGLPITEKES